MGLLDIDLNNPGNAAQLALAAGLLGTPGSFGRALSAALPAMTNAYGAAQQQQQARKLGDLQIAATQQGLDKGQMDLAAARLAQQRQQQQQTLVQQFVRNPQQQAMAANGGPTRAAAEAAPETAPGFDFQGYAQALAAVDPNASLEMMGKLRKEQPKLKSVEPMRGEGGQMVNVALFEDGTTKVLPYGVRPDIALQALGDRVVAIDKNATSSGQSFALGQSPDSKASNGLGWARLAFDKSKEAADRANPAGGKYEYKQDVAGNWVALPKEPAGEGPIVPRYVDMAGKRQQQARDALGIVDSAEALIDKATSSYLGAGMDQAARVVGASTPGAQASAQLKALEGALMMAQPRMEGPQSDKDVMLYRQMAGQIGDPTVPAEQKRASLAVIRQLHERYAAQGTPGAAPAAVPAAPSTFRMLPNAAQFDGKTMRNTEDGSLYRSDGGRWIKVK